jgi:hypothetical protein
MSGQALRGWILTGKRKRGPAGIRGDSQEGRIRDITVMGE